MSPILPTPLDRLLEVGEELARAHRELADLVATEKEGKVTGYFRAEESSVSARDREAEFQVLPLTTDIIRLKGKIAALEVEHRTLLAWLEFQGRTHAGE